MTRAFLSVELRKVLHSSEDVALFVEESAELWAVTTADGSLKAMIKKRLAYPTTYCRQINRSTVCLGYGDESQDEFLTVTIRGNQMLSIVRDKFATLPLFYYSDDTQFVLFNEYADVLANIEQPVVRTSAIVDHLIVVDRPMPPPIEGVETLKEQERLTFRADKGVTVQQAPGRPWLYSSDVPVTDPKLFFEKFSAYLDYFIASRLSEQQVAFVISGGLDSATLPQYFYQQTNQPIIATSLLHGPPYAATQQPKLQAIFDQTQATSVVHTLDPATMAPLSGMTAPRYGEALYTEAFTPLIRRLRDMGVRVLATGEGGDEIFGNVTDESFAMIHGEKAKAMRHEMSPASFFTPKLWRTYLAAVPQAPLMPLPHRPANIAHGQLLNNLYIREDIWPVSPFTSPDLYQYIQSIPAHFRANKNILRAFHKAKGFTELIYNAPKNEFFDVFFQKSFASGAHDSLMNMVLPTAKTVEMEYVDAAKLRDAYNAIKQSSTQDESEAFRLFCFLQLEVSLHMAGARLTA